MSDNISSEYIRSFRNKRKSNKKKSWLVLLLIIILSSLLSFFLVDYTFPIAVDNFAFRINYYLLIAGIIWQIIILLFDKSYTDKGTYLLAVIPPTRRKPLFGKNLTRIRAHHPKPILPLVNPVVMGHIITWVASVPGAIMASILLPGEVRKWKGILKTYGGISLAIGSSIYLIFAYMALKWDYTLLTINIVNSLLVGLSIPGLAVVFYTIGSAVASHKGTPERTIIGAIIIILIWLVLLMFTSYPLIERFLFNFIFKLASGFWLIIGLYDIHSIYAVHKK